MWRSVFVLCLLLSSTTFAGESRGQMQVGITITGKSNSPALSANTAAGAIGETAVSIPLPKERPTARRLSRHRDSSVPSSQPNAGSPELGTLDWGEAWGGGRS